MISRVAPLVVVALTGSSVLGQSTAFTYQGELRNSGQLANGVFDFQFRLFDAASGGTQQGATVCLDNVPVAAGRFTTQLNFGQQFLVPAARFLEVQVRADTGLDCTNAAGFVILSRQPVTAAPLANHAKAAYALDAPDGAPANAVFVSNSGQVGIGTTSPTATLHVNGNLGVGAATIPTGLTPELGGSTPLLNLDMNFRQSNHIQSFLGGAIRIDSRNDAADPLFQFLSRPAGSGVESMVGAMNQAGRMTLGAPFSSLNTSTVLELHGHSGFDDVFFYIDGHTRVGTLEFNDRFFIDNYFPSLNGAQLEDDGTWSILSDGRCKTEVVPAAGMLDKALALRPAEFYMKHQDRARDPHIHLGLIAQEVLPVLPSLVYPGQTLRMNYDRLGVVAIGAIQEQQRIIQAQRHTIAQLQARDADLEARLQRLESRISADMAAPESPSTRRPDQ